jgi:hypothetical protein
MARKDNFQPQIDADKLRGGIQSYLRKSASICGSVSRFPVLSFLGSVSLREFALGVLLLVQGPVRGDGKRHEKGRKAAVAQR